MKSWVIGRREGLSGKELWREKKEGKSEGRRRLGGRMGLGGRKVGITAYFDK